MADAFAKQVRNRSRAICWPGRVTLAVLCSASFCVWASAQSGTDVSIEYTGALFGYFRTDGPKPGKNLEAVEKFLHHRENRSTLLLGMGNNFGPEFGAALQYDDPTQTCLENKATDKKPPERFYKADDRIVKFAHCDNVASFLLRAGYRAVVPGREDFIYSAAWLQAIARKLRADPENLQRPEGQRLVILAGNMRLGAQNCALILADEGSSTPCADSFEDKVPVAQDWIARLDLTLTEATLAKTIKDRTKDDPNTLRQMTVNEMKQLLEVAPNDYREELKYFASERAYTIIGKTVGIPKKPTEHLRRMATDDCISTETAEKKDLCLLAGTLIGRLQEMPGKQPVFLDIAARRASERLMLRRIAKEARDIGYTFDDRRPGVEGRTLIVGVVARDMMNPVSPTYVDLDGAKIRVLDPVATAVTLIRAASLVASEEKTPVRKTIVMAQMSRADTEELATRLRVKLRDVRETLAETTDVSALHVDLILSEAQPDRATSDVRLDYNSSELIPVITPRRAFNVATETVEDPVSTVTLSARHGSLRPNRMTINASPEWVLCRGQKTALELLLQELKVSANGQTSDETQIAGVTSMFDRLARYEKADVVLLPRRDMYFGRLPDEYAEYETCTGKLLTDGDKKNCKLRVALDRVFWKGDYFERVMMSGQDLKKVLKTAQQNSQSETNLAPKDITGQWLYTFGIVTNEQDQLTRIEMSSERFSLPQNKACKGDKSAVEKEEPYCINGATISDDASYWVVTNDSLAHDAESTHSSITSWQVIINRQKICSSHVKWKMHLRARAR